MTKEPSTVVVTKNGTAHFFYNGADWDCDVGGFVRITRDSTTVAVFAPGEWACAMDAKEYGSTNWNMGA